MVSLPPVLGVLRLSHGYPTALGDVACPKSFPYHSLHQRVPGLTFSLCQEGDIDDRLKEAFVTAVRWLEEQGVSGITGDCGFMIHHQALVRSVTHLPVFLSSLVLLPSLLTAYSPSRPVAVFTANSNIGSLKTTIHKVCGLEEGEGDGRVLVVGCQHIPGFEAVALGTAVDLPLVEAGVVALARKVQRRHPNLAAFLFECTQLPPFSSAVRRATSLPVWDAVTAADHFIQGSSGRTAAQNWHTLRKKTRKRLNSWAS